MERKKSKFLAFLLNTIPGLGQIYYGDKRGVGVGFLTVAGLAFCGLLSPQYHAMISLAILGYAFMIIVSEIMTFSFSIEMEEDEDKKIVNTALILSFVPGVGHLYLGMMEKGMLILASALFCIFLSGFLGSVIFIFILPLIFAYSIFDVRMVMEDREIVKSSITIRPWLGYFLVFSGILIIVEKLISPYIPYEVMRKFKILLIAVGMIIGGLIIIKPEIFKKASLNMNKESEKNLNNLCENDFQGEKEDEK